MVKKIAFINGKGGCGKTTSIFHIAGVLAQKNQKVLVIDLDKQRNTTDTLLMNTDFPKKTIVDVFSGEQVQEAVVQSLFQTRGNALPKYYGVDCLVSDVRLEDEALLKSILDEEKFSKELKIFIEKNGYDWVLVDMPPSNLTLNHLCFKHIVNDVVLPFSSDIFSVNGYADIMEIMDKAREENPTLRVLGVYLARFMSNCLVDKYIKEEMSKFDTFINVQIPLASDLREAIMFGRPISFYKQFSKSKSAYIELVKQIELKMKERV